MPATPKNFRATGTGPTTVGFTVDRDDDLIRVQRKQGTSWRDVAEIPAGKTSATETGLEVYTKYAYRARAINGRGEKSTPTDVDYATTLKAAAPPPAPEPEPTPVPTLPALTVKQPLTLPTLTLLYPPTGALNWLWKNGAKTENADSNGSVDVQHGAIADYAMHDGAGKPVTQTLRVNADGSTGVTPVPDPEPEPEDPVVTDPEIPPNAIRVTSLATLNNTMQGGAAYLIEGRHTYTSSAGIKAKAGVQLFFAPGAIIESTGTAYDFPRAIEVLADDVLIHGGTFAGPGKAIGVQLNSGVRNTRIVKCTAPDNGLGTFIENKGAINLTWTDCTFQRLRRYGHYGKLDGGFLRNLKFGDSTGGSWKGASFNGEHNLRFEFYRNVLIESCECMEAQKSGINAKRGDGLTVRNFRGPIIGLGPLGDNDGLVHKDDPAYIARGIVLENPQITDHLTLEMGVVGLVVTGGSIRKVEIVSDSNYEPVRQEASGTFTAVQVGSWSGDRSRITVN